MINLLHGFLSHSIRIFLLVFAFLNFLPSAYAGDFAKSAEAITPILVGATLPDVTLKSTRGDVVRLNQFTQKKPTVLIFYRGGWCPYCNAHLADLRKIEGELQALGFQILAISPDQPKFLQETAEKNKLGYTLLSDSSMNAAKALGLAFEVDGATLKKYSEYGIDLERNSGQAHHLLPVPAAILVNTQGDVTFTFIAPNYKVRLDKDVLLAAAKAQVKLKK